MVYPLTEWYIAHQKTIKKTVWTYFNIMRKTEYKIICTYYLYLMITNIFKNENNNKKTLGGTKSF